MGFKEYLKAWFKWLAYSPDEMPKLGPRIAVIGGGSGLAKLLEGLKRYTHNLYAIVTVFDSGGSTGRLREQFRIPALGDLRNCLVALAEEEELMRDLFAFRFGEGKELKGHSLGNLFLTALFKLGGNLQEATEAASLILKVKGKVLPSSLGNAHLWAELENGEKVQGEAQIPEVCAKKRLRIKKIWLEPPQKVNPEVKRTLKKVDLIVIGPGSLFTSVLPNFLVKGLREAVNTAKAKKVYVVNVAQERGETMGFSVEEHLDWLLRLKVKPDLALVNRKIVAQSKDVSRLGEVQNITTSRRRWRGIELVKADLVDRKAPLYHDPDKLARKILEIAGFG
ncbi:YvcK family protein [bacterium]|nr:YvcK family protein [bacterium]